MLVKLIEVEKGLRGSTAKLREVYINPQHIISVTDDIVSNETLVTETVRLGLSDQVAFSKVTIQEGNVPRSLVIVGTPREVYNKIKKKQILKG